MNKDSLHKIQNFMSIDLEMNQPSRKIIQIGICIGDLASGKIIEKKSYFINPRERLSDYISRLTAISQERVDNGVSLKEAYIDIAFLHKKHDCHKIPLIWGGNDSVILKSQLNIEENEYIFGRCSIDVKNLYQTLRIARGDCLQGGIKSALKQLNLSTDGKHHDALVDATNTFNIYSKFVRCIRSFSSSLCQEQE